MNHLKSSIIAAFIVLSGVISAQNSYEIKFQVKNNADTMMYLIRTLFDKQYISDTCKHIKNGQVVFKGKRKLDPGVYTLVSQEKTIYFDFLINECTKFSVSYDRNDIANTLKTSNCPENANMFEYLKYMTNKNAEYNKFREKMTYKDKQDSVAQVDKKLIQINDDIKAFEVGFLKKVKGTFVYDFINMKTEKEAENVPLASNGRPDSLYRYYYYKNHFLDGIDFTDDRIVTIPFFDDRIKRYLEGVIYQYSPDTLSIEIDKILSKCKPDGLVYSLLLGHLTYKAETDKRMGFDKVFVHLADNYILNGKAKNVYSDETVEAIRKRIDILRHLLIGSKAQDLFMIDTTDGKKVLAMGFDTVKTSKGATDLYVLKENELMKYYKSLYMVNSKYTVLVFWDVDCGHCQTEIPKLNEELQKLKGKIDFKVFAVYTQTDFERWKKYIVDKKLDFFNVFDPMHLNNIKEKYDIIATPVIYILDKNKVIKGKKIGAEQVPDLLNYLESSENSK